MIAVRGSSAVALPTAIAGCSTEPRTEISAQPPAIIDSAEEPGMGGRGLADATTMARNPAGTWIVVAHRMPGVSAMSDADAGSVHGRSLHYRADLDVTSITCAGAPWTAPGSLLIWASANRAWTVWDGVVLAIERRESTG